MAEEARKGGGPMKLVLKEGKVYRSGRRRYPNGDVYDGEFLGGKREGTGTMRSAKTGDRYTGEWAGNVYHGNGTLWSGDFGIRKDGRIKGTKYEGGFKKGKKHGFGVEVAEVHRYEGEWKLNAYDGEGILRKDDEIVEGNFERGKPSGYCRIETEKGDVYQGYVLRGERHGEGRQIFKQGGFYKGEFRNGSYHGHGTRRYVNQSEYTGEFLDNERSGEGSMRWANGDCYVGMWKRDQPDGRGVFAYAHGDRYEGSLEKGVPCGRGRYTYADGGYYEGDFSHRDLYRQRHTQPSGKRSGKGTRVWVSGATYVGEWRDGQMHGAGKFTSPDGCVYQGQFEEGRRHGLGTSRWGNQLGLPYYCGMGFKHPGRGYCRYEGAYSLDYRQGSGKFTCLDGRSYDGDWHSDQRHGDGTMVLCPVAERGDVLKRGVGGVDGLYRVLSYSGKWLQDRRHGFGSLLYCDGTRVDVDFSQGLAHGTGTVVFRDGTSNRAQFLRGRRLYWLDAPPGSKAETKKKFRNLIGKCVDAMHAAFEEDAHQKALDRQAKIDYIRKRRLSLASSSQQREEDVSVIGVQDDDDDTQQQASNTRHVFQEHSLLLATSPDEPTCSVQRHASVDTPPVLGALSSGAPGKKQQQPGGAGVQQQGSDAVFSFITTPPAAAWAEEASSSS